MCDEFYAIMDGIGENPPDAFDWVSRVRKSKLIADVSSHLVDIISQVELDLPRCNVVINGVRTTTMLDLYQRLSVVDDRQRVAILTLLTQGVMGIALELSQNAAHPRFLGERLHKVPMDIVVSASPESWSVAVHKYLRVVDVVGCEIVTFEKLVMNINVTSDSDWGWIFVRRDR